MNTTEYHSKETFTRCHTCRNFDQAHGCMVSVSVFAIPDGQPCLRDQPTIHSGHLHDEKSAMKGGIR